MSPQESKLPQEFFDRLKKASKAYIETQDPDEYRNALRGNSTRQSCTPKAPNETVTCTPVLLQWKEQGIVDSLVALKIGNEELKFESVDGDGDETMRLELPWSAAMKTGRLEL